MEITAHNHTQWQAGFGYQQAVEVRDATSTLYVSGQAAMNERGEPSTADMATQLAEAIGNLEAILARAGYPLGGIVRLTVYTTDHDGLLPHFPTLTAWLAQHGIRAAMTLLTVQRLYGTLSVQLEATAVR